MTEPEFTWDSSHPAFHSPVALKFLQDNVALPEHAEKVYKTEFFAGGSYTDHAGTELDGPHMRVYRFAVNDSGRLFMCWHGFDGEDGNHAAEARPLDFPLDDLPREIGGEA